MKQIYGIDLSQEKFDVCFLDDKKEIKTFIVKNKLKSIEKFLEGLPSGAILCAEHTGVYGTLLTFLANCMDIPIALTPGYSIRHSLGMLKGKSDKIDAIRIREYGERFFDKLRFVKHNEDIEELKELYSLRSQLVKERKMLVTYNKGKAYLPANSIRANKVSTSVINSLTIAINDLNAEIDRVIMSKEELKENCQLIKKVNGIGHVTACDLIIKTGNFKQIDTARKASSYAGVCPFPNSSGKLVKKSRVSSMADKELKSLLYMCALAAIKSNPFFKLYYERKKIEGKPHYLITNNIANKLLRAIYTVLQTREEYVLGHISKDPRKSLRQMA